MKTYLTSKTIWFGLAQIVFGLIGLLSGWIESDVAVTLITTGVGTIGFRKSTSQPLGKIF